MLSDARITAPDVTRAGQEKLNPDLLMDMVEEQRRQVASPIVGITQTQTATAAHAFQIIAYDETRGIPEQIPTWEIDGGHTVIVRVNTAPSTPVSFLRSLLQQHRRDERLKRLSPERRVMYEDIRKLREEIGPIDFNVVEALRELRGDE